MFCISGGHGGAAAVIRCNVCNKYFESVGVVVVGTNINNCVTSNINVQFLTNSSACIASLTIAETPAGGGCVKASRV